jgi:hypothetical protein
VLARRAASCERRNQTPQSRPRPRSFAVQSRPHDRPCQIYQRPQRRVSSPHPQRVRRPHRGRTVERLVFGRVVLPHQHGTGIAGPERIRREPPRA